MKLLKRPRRLRQNESIRSLVREHRVHVDDLIMPLFVSECVDSKVEIKSMPGQFRFSATEIVQKSMQLHEKGLKAIALFPALKEEHKSSNAQKALDPNMFYYNVIKSIKDRCPDLMIMTDLALDPYSSDGHDGIVDSQTGEILNDATCETLSKMALLQAKAGADILGPSDMMDGRIQVIREALESELHTRPVIMSYSAKYASSFYGPFRDALDSAPKAGDKKTYQMDFANKAEALKETLLDIEEGADIVMVKPGLSYLDVVAFLKQSVSLPVAVYNVSGEYAMIKASAQMGFLDERSAIVETLTSFKRAGADIILTYFAEQALELI